MKISKEKIAQGVKMPIISLGLDSRQDNKAAKAAVNNWLELGGRGIDLTFRDNKIKLAGKAIAEHAGKIDRKDLFLTLVINTCDPEEIADTMKKKLEEL